MSAERRQVLRALGVAALGGFAGCNSGGSPAGTDTPTPTETPTDTPTPTETPTDTPTTPPPWPRRPTPSAKLAPDDGDDYDNFGSSVGVSGDGTTAIVCATGDEDPNGNSAGSTYVFSRAGGGWTQQAKLTPDDGDDYDNFGVSVGVSRDGSTAIVGAPRDEDPNGYDAGSAYVFSRAGGGWTQQAKLTDDDGDADDLFSWSVGVSGDGTTVLVGAPFDEDPNGDSAGSAYVFSQAGGGWTQQAKLTPDDGDAEDGFGVSIGVSGDGTTAFVGAFVDEDPNGDMAGSVYVFSQAGGGWTQQAKLVPDDGDDHDNFGRSVGVSGDGTTALVGAPFDEDPYGDSAGSAYVFSQAGGDWTQKAKLVPDDGDAEDWFASSVGVSRDGTTAILGAHRDDDPNFTMAGAAYVFSKAGGDWTQQAKLAPDDGDAEDWFGISVGVSGDGTTALVGALNDEDPNGDRAGSAYVFER